MRPDHFSLANDEWRYLELVGWAVPLVSLAATGVVVEWLAAYSDWLDGLECVADEVRIPGVSTRAPASFHQLIDCSRGGLSCNRSEKCGS
jgi:hypothetical protein